MTPTERETKIAYWRQKQETEGLSLEDLIEIVTMYSGERERAVTTVARAKTQKIKEETPVIQLNMDDLFGA